MQLYSSKSLKQESLNTLYPAPYGRFSNAENYFRTGSVRWRPLTLKSPHTITTSFDVAFLALRLMNEDSSSIYESFAKTLRLYPSKLGTM